MSNGTNLTAKDICRVAIDMTRSHREVGRMLSVSATTVAKYRNLMKIHKIDRTELHALSDAEVESLVQARYNGGSRKFVEPDWDNLCVELGKKDVTIALLYQEYVDALGPGQSHSAILSLSSFGRRLRQARKDRKISMRQAHSPGDKMFVDYSGKHLYLTNPSTRVETPVEVFVSSLGASQLLFAVAVPSQKLPDWVEANVCALEYYSGTTANIVPDNLKSAVTRPKRKQRSALINRTYLDFSEHYGVNIDPARSLHPQDKALAEIGVRIVNMWVIAALRNEVFYSLADMNAEITKIIDRINNKQSRRLGTSRRALFDEKEASFLSPLPSTRYEVVEWRDGLLVPKDYHVAFNGDYYSVPHTLVGQRVNIAISRSTLKAYVNKSVHPIAAHQLGAGTGANITQLEHMPADHRAYASESRDDLRQWASAVGSDVGVLFDAMAANKRVSPQSAIRQMSRAKTLAREYGVQRLVSACRYANAVGTQTVDSVKSILAHDVDLRDANTSDHIVAAPVAHDNVRGAASYDGSK